MKVKDLIDNLQSFDPDDEVVLSGYEGGYYDGIALVKVRIERDVNTEWWYGPHEITVSEGEGEEVIALMTKDTR